MLSHASSRHRRRSLTLLLLTVLATALSAVPAQAAGVGAVVDLSWGISRAEVDREVALLREANVRFVRINASWIMLEPHAKGVLDAGGLAATDYAVDAVRAAGIDVLMPISDGVPYWASADPAKTTVDGRRSWNKLWKPRSNTDYADIVRTVVDRYKRRGVHHYEIWNEPNLAHFWPSGPNPVEYTEMLKAGSAAVRSTDPEAKVVLGGLAGNDWAFFDRLYAAGARGHFDIANVHPYTGKVAPEMCWKQAGTTRNAKDALCGIEEIHRSMVANGDGTKPVWATEFGWSTYTGDYGVSEAAQADFLTRGYKAMEAWPWLKQAFWYSFRNDPWLREEAGAYNAHLGLTRSDFTKKPAFNALKAYGALASGGDALPPTEPAPAPDVIAAPTSPAPAPAPAPEPEPEPAPAPAPSVSAPAPESLRIDVPSAGQFVSRLRAGVTGITATRVDFLLDGKRIASDTTGPFALDYAVSRKVSLGSHTLTARATKLSGEVVSASIAVQRVRVVTATASSTRRASCLRTLRASPKRTLQRTACQRRGPAVLRRVTAARSSRS